MQAGLLRICCCCWWDTQVSSREEERAAVGVHACCTPPHACFLSIGGRPAASRTAKCRAPQSMPPPCFAFAANRWLPAMSTSGSGQTAWRAMDAM